MTNTAIEEELTSEDIVDILETDIIFGVLYPRERLVESALQRRFGVSRHVIRRAITDLVAMGVVEYQKNIGAMVKAYSKKEVLELYELRTILESGAAARIQFPVADKAIEGLKAIQREHDRAVKQQDKRALFITNIRFHNALYSLSGNDMLREAIEEYARKTHIVRFRSFLYAETLEQARLEHWEIIHALENQDREALVNVCGQHLIPSRDAYLAQHGN